MTVSRRARRWGVALALAVMAAGVIAQAQATQKPFVPESGRPGKDVVWVPSPQALVEKMLDLAKVTPQDFVMDLGSGDGRTVITAAKRGAHALGVEYDPDMFNLGKQNAIKAGVADKATFVNGDLFEQDLSKATVITMFLLPSINMKLRPKILDLKPGTRIVSNSFDMGEWVPDDTAEVTEDCVSWCRAMLWIVPAKVDGVWKTPQGDLTITQGFQHFSGTLGATPITAGALKGAEISFTAGNAQYNGRVAGAVIEGTVATGGKNVAWKASK